MPKRKSQEPQRVSYHVVPKSDGGWNVKREGAERASASTDTKKDAIDRARELAKSQPLGQVVLHRGDGVVQKEWTYRKDPRRHPG